MKERQISKVDALVLCQRAEGHFFDRKAAEISGTKLQKLVVAFANADGARSSSGLPMTTMSPIP